MKSHNRNNKKKQDKKQEKEFQWLLNQMGCTSEEEARSKADKDPAFRQALRICGIKLH